MENILDILGAKIIKNKSGIYYLIVNIPKEPYENILFINVSKLNVNNLHYFISTFINKNDFDDKRELLIEGTDYFVPNVDYHISNGLASTYNITSDELLSFPNYNINLSVNRQWETVVTSDILNSVLYLSFKNNIKDYVYSEDELLSLNSTFMNIIKDKSTFKDTNIGKNSIYKAVIDFYANGQYDEATVLMNTVLNSVINTTTVSNCNCGTQSTCASTITSGNTGINTGTEIISVDTASCIDKYKASIYQWLIQMLSDTDFYCCWMFMNNEELDESYPNELLIDSLIILLEEFLSLGLDLSNLGSTSTSACNCGHSKKYNGYNNTNNDCSDLLNNDNGLGCTNNSIIANYIKVLKWIKNNEIEENRNKIYIYGKQFAEIFPLLNF